jgi:hypothetical protein
MMIRYFEAGFVTRAAAIMLLSLAAIYWGMRENRNSTVSADWPAVPATILSSTVVEKENYGGRGGSTSKCFEAELRYEYKIRSQSYSGWRVSYHGAPCKGGKRGRRLAEELRDTYPTGTLTKAYYNPQDPGRACLQPGKTGDGSVLIVLGGIGLFCFFIYAGGRWLDRFSNIGDFAIFGTSEVDRGPIVVETSAVPLRAYLWLGAAILFISWIIFPLFIRTVVFYGSMPGERVPGYIWYLLTNPPVHFLLPVILIPLFLLWLAGRKTIRYGERGIILPPKSIYRKRHIPREAICYCYPHGFGPDTPRNRTPEGKRESIKLFFYRGPGVLLGYHPEASLWSSTASEKLDKSKLCEIHFPCRSPEQLCALICTDEHPSVADH